MKIKVLSLTTNQVEMGFHENKIYKVSKVEISGDDCAWDIFYHIDLDDEKKTMVNDFCIEIVESYKKYTQFINQIKKIQMPCKFELNLKL